MEQSSLTFFHIHVVHQAYKQRVQTELGILSHLLDKRLNETLSRESDYIVQEFLSPPRSLTRLSWISQNDNSKSLNVSHESRPTNYIAIINDITSAKYFHNLWKAQKGRISENHWRIYSNKIPPINPILIKRISSKSRHIRSRGKISY